MTETGAEDWRRLWFEDLCLPLVREDSPGLEERLGVRAMDLDDPSEWVLGYRIVGTARAEQATILYLTRRLRGSGARFELKTAADAPPDTSELHTLVKQYIREFTPVFEARGRGSSGAGGHARWHGAQSVLVDLAAEKAALAQRDVALARAHVAERLHVDVPALAALGLGGHAQVELSFPPGGGAVGVTVDLGAVGPFDRVRIRVRIGDTEAVKRFNVHGIAILPQLSAGQSTDLLHLVFEVMS